PTISELSYHGMLIEAQNVGAMNTAAGVAIQGSIDNTPAGGGQVDWYRFDLTDASIVTLRTLPDNHFASVLSLYNRDPFDFNDYYDPFGNRLLVKGANSLTQTLGPGTYYCAVSGNGNQYFSPYLADSGYAGATGTYTLEIQASDLGLGSSDGPRVLAVDPAM